MLNMCKMKNALIRFVGLHKIDIFHKIKLGEPLQLYFHHCKLNDRTVTIPSLKPLLAEDGSNILTEDGLMILLES